LTLQRERHPAPFFAPRPPAATAPPASPSASAASPAPQAAKPEEPAPVAVLPPERPAGLGASGEGAPAARHVDAIGDILREDASKEGQKAVLAAQSALIKLGYSLHADGVANAATLAALRDFERAHSLPVSTEVTPRLLKHLTAAANAAGR
jgi:hypothetical protein